MRMAGDVVVVRLWREARIGMHMVDVETVLDGLVGGSFSVVEERERKAV